MKIDTGDTAWLLVSTALVLFMTPGLALFYGGMVRRKNVLATLMHSFSALPLVTLQWVLVGYSLCFGAARRRAHRRASTWPGSRGLRRQGPRDACRSWPSAPSR